MVSSYWFFPATLFFLSILLAITTIRIDRYFGEQTHQFMQQILFFNDLSMDTVRTYLSTLVGAVITVVGVVFSLTILTVSSVSNQFGPRILNNFMRDRANQITLGVYTSTFVFASTVLLSLYEGGSSIAVPYLSIFVSYLLGLLCVGFLIFYVHHIPASLRIENIVYRIAKQALEMTEGRFPSGEDVPLVYVNEDGAEGEGLGVMCQKLSFDCHGGSGYVQAVDLEGLVHLAKEKNALFDLSARPGTFVNGKSALLVSDTRLSLKDCERVRSAFAVGMDRTLPQNLMYLLSQLMEIAIRSMSPGINDPITAMSCVDWLELCLLKIMDSDRGIGLVLDGDRKPRIIVKPVDVAEVLFQVRKGLAEHMSKNYATALHLMESLKRMTDLARSDAHQDSLRACGAELLAFCKSGVPVGGQIERLAEIFGSFSLNQLDYPHEYQ